VRYAWIDKQREKFGLDEMFAVLDVSFSGYRCWKQGGKPERKGLTDAQMFMLIQSIHAEFRRDLRKSTHVQVTASTWLFGIQAKSRATDAGKWHSRTAQTA